MIAFINGTLRKKTSSEIIVEAGGIGYSVFVSISALSQMGNVGQDILVYTYMKISEDGISLYGFLSEQELQMFNYLIGVNGIGPKNAMQILSRFTPDKIVSAIIAEDGKTLSEAPGIGKKTAARLILDLKDKFNKNYIKAGDLEQYEQYEATNSASNTAIDALMALGYSQTESVRAVASINQGSLSEEEIIKLALKKMVAT